MTAVLVMAAIGALCVGAGAVWWRAKSGCSKGGEI